MAASPAPAAHDGPLPAAPRLVTDAACVLLFALDALAETHRETPIRLKDPQGNEEEMLLGSLQWRLPQPDYKLPLEEDAARFPLLDVLEAWWNGRQPAVDPLDLLRAAVALRSFTLVTWFVRQNGAGWTGPFLPLLFVDMGNATPMHPAVTRGFLFWLLRLHPPAPNETTDLLLDAVEFTLSLVPAEILSPAGSEEQWRDWRVPNRFLGWLIVMREHFAHTNPSWSESQVGRYWRLLRWLDEPHPTAPRWRPGLEETLAAFRAGAATVDDLYDQLLGERPAPPRGIFNELRTLSGRKPNPSFAATPGLPEIYERCRARILDVELARGDTPTAATGATRSLRYVGGADILTRVVKALGKESFVRGYGYRSGDNRASVFSHLARATFPGEEDTPEAFAARMRAAGIPEKRLIEVAVYAPQWTRHVETMLRWPQFAEAVWWLHAHTKDSQWSVDQDIREVWAAEIGDKTPLSAADLLGGAVDVAWFHRVHDALGEARWKQIDEAAKFASSSGGHTRARLYADAMQNRLAEDDLRRRIAEKRSQDAVRALGLLPLPLESDRTARDAVALSRYKLLQEFRRTARQFGAQRQESEKLAARIGLENLARTAGYPDPVRLEWAMEAEAVADLKNGEAVSAQSGDVTVTLRITAFGDPELTFLKNDRAIKTLPPAVKKDPAIAAIVDRRKETERQRSRMRLSLEEAMCRGDRFSAAELAVLWEHPILQPMLRSLVFVGESALIGYPVADGRALEDFYGVTHTLPPDTMLTIAHPYDLLQTGAWDRWQRDCFRRERVQPFKQVFRELYVLTDQEREDGTRSRRYAGHQVNPKQALALLGKRGWVSGYEEGVRRTFHEAGITVQLDSMGWTGTAADVEGLTIEEVRFTRRGEWKPLPLSEIPPRLFSEAMRDLDLVVSVAHQGGVDPEATASTVEMRAALVREAAALLKLDNVRLQKSHALIDGKLGTYSVHLGSAIVHRQPGGFVCIVPVHSQHRGRLFLPFVDDDPRTAEVISKVLLLAKDSEIKDPTILEQIFSVR